MTFPRKMMKQRNPPTARSECEASFLTVERLLRPTARAWPARQAMYMSIDKESIVKDVYHGLQSPTESFLPTQTWAFNPNLPEQHYEPDGAKKLLDEAGWKLGVDGVRTKNGVRLEFTNSTTAGNQLREQVQQLLQQSWQDLGIKMTIKNLPPAVMWGDYWMQSQFDTGLVLTAVNLLLTRLANYRPM